MKHVISLLDEVYTEVIAGTDCSTDEAVSILKAIDELQNKLEAL